MPSAQTPHYAPPVQDPSRIEEIRHVWREHLRTAPVVASVAGLVLLSCIAAHVARVGTPVSRVVAASVVGLLIVAILWSWFGARAALRTLDGTLRHVVGRAEPEVAARAVRAVRLAEQLATTPEDPGAALAAVHFDRAIARASVKATAHAARERAVQWRWVAVVSGLATTILAVADPLRVVEGIDVLFAQNNQAPWAIPWLEAAHVRATQPAYLREEERTVHLNTAAQLPVGTQVVVRGFPNHEGRELVLTDGTREVPFSLDGHGLLVARWTLEESGILRVAAKFGEVLIYDPNALAVRAVADLPPTVTLETAPRVVRLAELTRLDLAWNTADDHGLRQVDLVLRSGEREERRNLGHFDGETRLEQGAHALTPRDEFLRTAFLPVEISVEARDNDPLSSDKWGKSGVITALPPAIGEAEAQRFSALLDARNSLTTLLKLQLAWQRWERQVPTSTEPDPSSAEEKAKLAEALQAARQEALRLEGTVLENFSGLGVSRGMQNFTTAILEPLRKLPERTADQVRTTEDSLLALDQALKSLGETDAKIVSKRLADVAEAVAHGAKLARETERRSVGLTRVDQAMQALEEGTRQLSVLSDLGRDLGSVADAAIDRIQRARSQSDLFHTELAALHLAARLRRPNPSFSSSGGGGGVESGPGSPSPGEGEGASNAHTEFDKIAEQLQMLAVEHAEQIQQVESTLQDAQESLSSSLDPEEAKRRAEDIRRAVSTLPVPGEPPGTARATAALSREHAEASAESLEKLDLMQMVENAKLALSSFDTALGTGQLAPGMTGQVEEARRVVTEHKLWAEELLKQEQAKAQQKAKQGLTQLGTGEQELSERAQQILQQGRGASLLPEQALESLQRAGQLMRDAANSLRRGDGEKALAEQQEAQKFLEQAETGKTSDSAEGDSGQAERSGDAEGSGKSIAMGGEVPGKQESDSAEKFRKRVVDGLSKRSDGPLAPAIRKYAEGLLR